MVIKICGTVRCCLCDDSTHFSSAMVLNSYWCQSLGFRCFLHRSTRLSYVFAEFCFINYHIILIIIIMSPDFVVIQLMTSLCLNNGLIVLNITLVRITAVVRFRGCPKSYENVFNLFHLSNLSCGGPHQSNIWFDYCSWASSDVGKNFYLG